MDQETSARILQANLEVHQLEAPHYDAIHSEIFNPIEQKRLSAALGEVVSKIPSHSRRALDVGCGTGNITLKLLELGLEVDALDLSAEMLGELSKKAAPAVASGRLRLHCGPLSTLPWKESYGLITAYSVLHHLPDYLDTVQRCLELLVPGGILFIDHEHLSADEHSPSLENFEQALMKLEGIVRLPYLVYRKALKVFAPEAYRRLRPNIDYSLSDYWVHEGRHLDVPAIAALAKTKDCQLRRETYLNYNGRWTAPLIYRIFAKSAADTQRLIISKLPA